METEDNRPKSDVLSSRRTFLKSAGSASAVLAGSIAVTPTLSAAAEVRNSSDTNCKFSALRPGFAYLNSGTEGSMPSCVLDALQQGHSQWASDPTTNYELDPVFGKRQELNRQTVADFLGVGKNNVCLTDNTTMGLSMTLMGLNFRPDDKVVMTNHEHNAIKSPLQIHQAKIGLHVETQIFPSSKTLDGMGANELVDTLFPNKPKLRGAKALCVSHVYPTTGVRLPLSALRAKADQLGIEYLVVDGAQALGMIDLTSDAENIANSDFYACPGHKWLNGPPSTGVLYIRNASIKPPEFFPTVSQRMGMYENCSSDTESCFPMAEALQVRGCSNTPGFAAMIRAIEFVEANGGSTAVEKHILGLSRRVKEIILARSPSAIVSPHTDERLASGLTVFFPFKWDDPTNILQTKESADWVVKELLERDVQVRSIGFSNSGTAEGASDVRYAIRVSTALFNTTAQIDKFELALKDVLQRVA